MGNGINIDANLPLVKHIDTDCINLIGVAALAPWHGYDRVIRAMADVETLCSKKITFTIVGGGEELIKLKNLAKELKVNGVNFAGELRGSDLNDAFNSATLGVSSLGLYRIGLNEASVLKTREYMARGLCVLAAGSDPDFSDHTPYRYLVPNDETIEPITNFLINFSSSKLMDPTVVREYAQKNLTYNSKISKIIN
jgi:glycosyltransferase involved in cell wall biosynthesis